MNVVGLAIDAGTQSPIILLRDPSSRRQVPIWIDATQAHNLINALRKNKLPSKCTHDLALSFLHAGNLKIDRVIINGIEEKTFRSILKLIPIDLDEGSSRKKEFIELDARPSDAIALAIRENCSIWMLESVLAEASISVNAEADQEDQHEFRRFLEEVSPADIIRHLNEKKNNPPED
tara:strand:- start:6 stop:536 length:531 start_codon:yes stop_codon:yes gene_type:complete